MAESSLKPPANEGYQSELSVQNRIFRSVWGIVYLLAFRPSPRIAFGWRRLLLRAFGAKVGVGVKVYNSVEFFHPGNAVLEKFVILGPNVDFYNVATITVGEGAIVSQHAHLCAATHDFQSDAFTLLKRPITIGTGSWVCAGAFIGPGVTLGRRAVVGARAVVVKDVAAETVVAGNPARVVRKRNSKEAS